MVCTTFYWGITLTNQQVGEIFRKASEVKGEPFNKTEEEMDDLYLRMLWGEDEQVDIYKTDFEYDVVSAGLKEGSANSLPVGSLTIVGIPVREMKAQCNGVCIVPREADIEEPVKNALTDYLKKHGVDAVP